MKTKKIFAIASIGLALLLVLTITPARAQYCCDPLFPLTLPFYVAGAVVGTAAAIVTAPFAPYPYYHGGYYAPPPPRYYAPAPGYYGPPPPRYYAPASAYYGPGPRPYAGPGPYPHRAAWIPGHYVGSGEWIPGHWR